jgi:hypothetical protein
MAAGKIVAATVMPAGRKGSPQASQWFPVVPPEVEKSTGRSSEKVSPSGPAATQTQ